MMAHPGFGSGCCKQPLPRPGHSDRPPRCLLDGLWNPEFHSEHPPPSIGTLKTKSKQSGPSAGNTWLPLCLSQGPVLRSAVETLKEDHEQTGSGKGVCVKISCLLRDESNYTEILSQAKKAYLHRSMWALFLR